MLKQLFAFSFSGIFLSVFVFCVGCLRVSANQDGRRGQWGISGRTENGSCHARVGAGDRAQEIERLRMELQRTSIKQKESIP